MNIVLRGIDKRLVQLADEKAKALGMSRNEFLKMYLKMLDSSNVLDNELRRYKDALKQVNKGIAFNDARLKSLSEGFNKLYVLVLLASGITPEEVDLYIKELNI